MAAHDMFHFSRRIIVNLARWNFAKRISTNVTASREVDNRVVVVVLAVAAAFMTWLCYGGATRGIKKRRDVCVCVGGAVAPLSK